MQYTKIDGEEYRERILRMLKKQMAHYGRYVDYLKERPWFAPLYNNQLNELWDMILHNASLYNTSAVDMDDYANYYVDKVGGPVKFGEGVNPNTNKLEPKNDNYEEMLKRIIV